MGFSEEERNTIIGALREWQGRHLADVDEQTRVLLRTARVVVSVEQINELCTRIARLRAECERQPGRN
jgi:hypothetical protein